MRWTNWTMTIFMTLKKWKWATSFFDIDCNFSLSHHWGGKHLFLFWNENNLRFRKGYTSIFEFWWRRLITDLYTLNFKKSWWSWVFKISPFVRICFFGASHVSNKIHWNNLKIVCFLLLQFYMTKVSPCVMIDFFRKF